VTIDSTSGAPPKDVTSDDASRTATALDQAGIERLESELGSTEALRRPVELFGTQTPELLAEMRSAIEAGDAVAVGRKAHKLKGGCLALAAARTAELCRELEVRVGDGSVQDATALVDQIEGAFEVAHAALRDCVNSK
jgi:HPt (histidine-containing phosphotransfer) domain-containing protein